MLNKQIEILLSEALGAPTRVCKKVSAWEINSNAEIVLETNYENEAVQACVWLPIEFKTRTLGPNLILYPEGKGRHSNTYPSKGLEKGKAAIKLKLNDTIDAEKIITAIA